jgi:hypothetical protein
LEKSNAGPSKPARRIHVPFGQASIAKLGHTNLLTSPIIMVTDVRQCLASQFTS